ncbi:hypothetical protein AB9F35_37410, partial [Rhizobium leguminosarum]
ADRMMRRLGRLTSRHILMLTNLRNAFPEKSKADIEEIALASWGNMGRLAAVCPVKTMKGRGLSSRSRKIGTPDTST